MKRILRITGKILLTFFGLVLLYMLSAWCLSRITVDKEAGSKEEVSIYIKTNGVHTDIVMPTRNDQIDWSREIKYSHTHLGDTMYPYLAMGWGDKGFYLETPNWSDLKASIAFKAAFALGTSTVHATFHKKMWEGETCRKIEISKEQYSRLINFISDSFQKDSAGHFINIVTDANYGDSDAFYEANGSYSMFQTCNTWANDGLKTSGQKCCLWTPFDTGIFLKYEK